ncbi:NUDIX hydrolase [Kosakonia sp.]|uniref:NUDIX hydrolase n=1 Tax=Kosakonia sp. TaxID=1916651 RepID=UPI0028A1D08A|nr:NUDIX hydrolase [Kosakonia sp.]
MSEIKTLTTTEIYRNRWMRLREDRILRADGNEGVYSVVEKADFVVIIALQDGGVFVVEQFRYPLQLRTIELPQGAWECAPDEDPRRVAAGELKEETGLVAGKMTQVGYQKLAQGYSSQGYHIFLAEELTHEQQDLDLEEVGLTARKIPFAEFEALIRDGKISDATSVTAWLLAKLKGMIP